MNLKTNLVEKFNFWEKHLPKIYFSEPLGL